MSVRMHILARWYEARARRAQTNYLKFKARAEQIWSALTAREGAQ